MDTVIIRMYVYVISNCMGEAEEGSMFFGLWPISTTGSRLLHCELNGALPSLFVAVINYQSVLSKFTSHGSTPC